MCTYRYSVVVVKCGCVIKGGVRVVGGTHKVGAQATEDRSMGWVWYKCDVGLG